MDFVEQPLSYEEARRGLMNFERAFKKDSAALFSGEISPGGEIEADVFFEWKSYYDFVREVDDRLEAALMRQTDLEEVVYASRSGSPSGTQGCAVGRKRASMSSIAA